MFSPATIPYITFDEFSGTGQEYRELNPNGTLGDITIDLISMQGFAGSPLKLTDLQQLTHERALHLTKIRG